MLEEGEFVERLWGSLKVGEIVRLSENESCPADLVLVYTSNENMVCYVDNSKLGGETEYKVKEVMVDAYYMY